MGASMLVDLGTYYVQLVYRVAGQIHLLIMCRRIWYGTGGGGIIGWHGIGWWKHMGWVSPLFVGMVHWYRLVEAHGLGITPEEGSSLLCASQQAQSNC